MNACVYVVDDDRLVRESLEWLLESVNLSARLYANGYDFLDDFTPGLLGCLVLDVRMPHVNGMDLYQTIKQIDPNFPVIIVTGHADVPLAIRAMKQGVFDFIEKPYNDQHMLERIQTAIHQCNGLHKTLERKNARAERFEKLSKREFQVLQQILQGKPNKLIADDLCISIKTVEVHRANLMQKLEVKTVTELVRLSILAGKDTNHPDTILKE
ncbi:response regulator transcription factor [Thiomicrorhabdus cannonii]|uniref:response regulator transcription factor n=1 Tax=Thiomicrorhabdus cannonii TaxID=2748011 RepID=UPI0015BEC707|nr:response regulator [Thiomicrorhabdus cannonii]